MNLSGQNHMLRDQSGDEQDTENVQDDGDRIGFFLLREFLGYLRERFVHGQGDLHGFFDGVAVRILSGNCDCAVVGADGIREGGEGQLSLLRLTGGNRADQDALIIGGGGFQLYQDIGKLALAQIHQGQGQVSQFSGDGGGKLGIAVLQANRLGHRDGEGFLPFLICSENGICTRMAAFPMCP